MSKKAPGLKPDRLFFAEPRLPVGGMKMVVSGYNSATGTGTIRVTAEKTSGDTDTTRVVVIIRDADYAETMPPTIAAAPNVQAGFTELAQDDIDPNFFSHDTVPVLGLPAVSPTANNKKVWIGSYDVTNQLIETRTAPFMAFPTVFPVVVDARNCLWLTFAEAGSGLPNGETGPEYMPRALVVPDVNALNVPITKVLLAATAGVCWQKGPDPALIVDANGSGVHGDVHASYKIGGTVHSDLIVGDNLPKGKLVAMWTRPGTFAATELPVGITAVPLIIDVLNRPEKLHLAFHDGVEWTNNTGSVLVQVTWQTG